MGETASPLLCGCQIVVPQSLQKKTLQRIHSGHQGITKCSLQVASSVCWPEVKQQLEDLIHNCPECSKTSQAPEQPLVSTTLPQHPWEKVASDLFEMDGKTYLLVVNFFQKTSKSKHYPAQLLPVSSGLSKPFYLGTAYPLHWLVTVGPSTAVKIFMGSVKSTALPTQRAAHVILRVIAWPSGWSGLSKAFSPSPQICTQHYWLTGAHHYPGVDTALLNY